jgi:hypothetical protein
MAQHFRATVMSAMAAAAALFPTQPGQAATAAVQPHSIISHQASEALFENVGRRGGWGYRPGVYRHGGYGYRRGVYRRGLYGSRYGYYRPYRGFYGGGFPAYGYGNGYGYANDYGYADDYDYPEGYANGYGYGNGYGYANDYIYGNGDGYASDYVYGNDCGCGYGYGYGAPVVTYGFGGYGGW